MEDSPHIPVLLHEVLRILLPTEGEIAVDGTVGAGGHALALCRAVGPSGAVLGIDEDESALSVAHERLREDGCTSFTAALGNFRDIGAHVRAAGFRSADIVLFDLGLSSLQLDARERGFSFSGDAPLIMSFSGKQSPSDAHVVVNSWDEESIKDILRGYGEERFSGRIARAIVRAREEGEIKTTGQLVAVIRKAVPAWYRFKPRHYATKTFQALRIAANDELSALADGLAGAWNVLARGGRIGVISYHSLEDRIVKRFIARKVGERAAHALLRKPCAPGEREIAANPRSRSAKFRALKKL